MIPSGYKEDVVYSEVPTNGNGDLSFTRASNGTRVNSAGLVEDTPWNLCEYSEDQTQWTSQNATTVTANSTTAPNGTTTADTVTPTAVNDDHYRGIVLSSQVGELTAFIYVKPNGYNFFDWGIYNGSQYIVRATFDLVNLTYTFTNAGTATIESVGNGWLKCGISGTNASLSTISLYYRSRPTGGTGAFTGNGTSGAFLWGAQLNIGTTAKPYFPTTDRLNVPRLTYQNGGGGCPSLLLEKQSTNLYPYSEDLTQWLTIGTPTITGNDAISPDGTTNADRVQFSGSGDLVYNSGTGSAGTNTLTVYAKAKTGTAQKFRFFANGATTFSSDFTATDQWQRFEFPFTLTVVTAGLSGASTGASDVLFWGFQHEVSSYPTSYIPTTSSSATRVADACSKTGISSLIGQTSGTAFVDFVYLGGVQAIVMELANSAANDLINVYITSSATTQCYMFDGGSQVGFINSSHTFVQGSRYKIAIGYASNDLVLYINGTQIGTATPSSIAATSEIYISRDKAALYLTDTKYNEVVIFPTRLTNAELASLTTI